MRRDSTVEVRHSLLPAFGSFRRSTQVKLPALDGIYHVKVRVRNEPRQDGTPEDPIEGDSVLFCALVRCNASLGRAKAIYKNMCIYIYE